MHRFGRVEVLMDCFMGNIRETPERWGEVHMGLPEHIDTILN